MISAHMKPIRPFKLLLSIIVLLVAVWVIRFITLFPWTPTQLVHSDDLRVCELIVVLGGEYYERIEYAFKLSMENYAQEIYIPSIGFSETQSFIAQKLIESSNDIRVVEGRGASSTYEEALLTKEYITQNNVSSIILVTSDYHSHRANWIFSRVMPDIVILTSPPTTTSEKLYRYFRTEQKKFFWYFVRYSLFVKHD